MEFLPEKLVKEWSWRVHDGIPNYNNPLHLVELKNLLIEKKFPHQFVDGLLNNLDRDLITEKKGDTSDTTFYHETIVGIITGGGKGPFKTGEDVGKWFKNGTIFAARGKNAKPIKNLKDKAYVDSKGVSFFDKSKIPSSGVVSDAINVGKKIKEKLGTASKPVLWTGPTNDASIYGAGDIGGKFGSYGKVGVSLKKGKGQLKNLTVNSFFRSLGLPKVNSDYFLKTYKKHWDAMTKDWMSLVEKNFKSKTKDKKATNIFKKHIKNTWDAYQKEKMTTTELDILNTALGTKIKYTKFRDFCRKLYEDYGKEWNEKRDKHFDNIFKEFSDTYDSQIRDGLHNLFKRQLSVGDTSLFYAAKGGNTFWFIPSKDLYERDLPPEAFISNYETKGSGSGYEFLLDVGVQTPTTGIPIGTVKVIFRFATGQMNGFPVTKSDYNLMAKDWSGLLGVFRK